MDALSQIPLTLALQKAGLAAGTTTTTTVGTTTPYAIKGKAYSKASASNGATPTTDATTGAAFLPIGLNQASVFVIGVDSGGNLKISQGQIVACDDSGNMANAPQFPMVPDTVCPLGYEIVKVASNGSIWTMGSSNQASQTGITKTFVDCITLPDRPQTS